MESASQRAQEGEFGSRSIESVEAGSDVRKSHPERWGSARGGGAPDTVVDHVEDQTGGVGLGSDLDLTWMWGGFDAVSDGVFNERLEHEGWNEAGAGARLEVELADETRAEADLLDIEVAVEEAEFILKGRLLAGGLGEGEAQEVGESDEHFLGGSGIFADERDDGVEGVEEKMRLELGLERVEPRLGEVGFEGEGAVFAFAITAVEMGGVCDADDRGERKSVEEDGRRTSVARARKESRQCSRFFDVEVERSSFGVGRGW